jgi:hypothetical protein
VTTRSKKDQQGYRIIGATLLVTSLGIAGSIISSPKPTCSNNPPHKTVIVLDQSEGGAQQTLDAIGDRARRWLHDSVSIGELVSIYPVSARSDTALRSVFSYCKPKRGIEANHFFESPRRIEAVYQARFAAPIDSILRMPFLASTRSPLAQALIDLSLSASLKADSTASLLIFSDLLENDRGFSVYSCSSVDEVIPKFLASRIGMTGRPTFRNTRVRLHVIPRRGLTPLQVKCRDRLWAWFFGDNAGDLASLDLSYLPGI